MEKKVRQTIRKYKLFSRDDKIAVAVSGGKDSTSCLYILKKLGYDVEAITIDVCVGEYSDTNIKNIRNICDELDVKLHILSFEKELGKRLPEIKEKLASSGSNNSFCMICGILKRYFLNKTVRDMGFDVVATGHNLDDEAQAFIMNVFRNDYKLALRQGPRPGIIESDNFITRVKPLYFVPEKDIIRFSKSMGFKIYYGKCPFSGDSFRRNFKNMLDEFEKKFPSIKHSITRFQENMRKNADIKVPEIGKCRNCQEPSSRELCKACELIAYL